MSKSDQLFKEAQHHLVGGVNSPVRSFKSVEGSPIFIQSAEGTRLLSVDGTSYIDYVLSWGPMILGHANPVVVKAIQDAAALGTSYGAPTAIETDLAKQVKHFYPAVDKVRFVNSGTEATMSAIRLARGYTRKSYIVKFKGCYHGHVDSLLVSAGSGALTHGIPDSAGVLPEFTQKTLLCDFNDSDGIQALFDQYGSDIAGVIIEPVTGNMGVILPELGFLDQLRRLCDSSGALLIFDEVMCGFRLASPGGAQDLFGVTADITCWGKVIGGGLPCAAYGGSASIMSQLAPEGPVYQAGTLSGNPLAMAAGLATLKLLADGELLAQLSKRTRTLIDGIQTALNKKGIPFFIGQCGSMFTVFLGVEDVRNLDDVNHCDFSMFKKYHSGVLSQGIYMAPSQYEANFMSILHTDSELEQTIHVISSIDL